MRVVLADGVFDPLHAGHLAYLQQARAIADDWGGQLMVQVSPQRKRTEFLSRRDRLSSLRRAGFNAVAFETTLDALMATMATDYVKGPDWKRGIPADESAYCAAKGITVHFTEPTPNDASSTALLRRWAAAEADLGVDALDAAAERQTVIPWDADANGYTLENRRIAEGRHPDILAALCKGMSVLDYGCGPGHLVTMLKERGVRVRGYDPHAADAKYRRDLPEDACYDVVVCREVLEHVPVREYAGVIANLFGLANRYVYITTRFNNTPAHPFDVTNETAVDPSHITCLPQALVRALCVLHGGTRDRAWEAALDWQNKGRVLVYRVTR